MSGPFVDLRLAGYSPPSAANPLLLGLSGKMKSGKTSLARWVVDKYGGAITSFAQTLKVEVYDALSTSDGCAEFYKWCQEAKHTIPAPSALVMMPSRLDARASIPQKIATIDEHKSDLRAMLEYWGDWRREYDPTYFIDRTVARIESLRLNHDVVVVDDVRTRQEVAALESLGFTIVRVQACDSCRAERGGGSNHRTETELDSHVHAHTVFNDTGIETARTALESAITRILTH